MRPRSDKRRPRTRPITALVLASALVLAACGTDDDPTEGIDLGDTDAAPDDPAPDEPSDVATSDEPSATPADDPDADPAEGDDSITADTTGEDGAPTDGGPLVDLSVATTGTWPVGDAGTVTFDVVDDALVLVDVSPAEGWDHVVDEEDADEIEVDFRRGDERWEFEVELERGRTWLEIELRRDLDDAPVGSHDLGEAGSFAFDVSGDRLVLTALDPSDGWEVVTREEDDDEIEIDLVSGQRRVDVEVELDDGRVELEIDLTVEGPLER